MSNDALKPELSVNNPNWLERHRYYELKHFCLQYPSWQKALTMLDGYSGESSPTNPFYVSTQTSDPTHTTASVRDYYTDRIEMVKRATVAADETLANYILLAVTRGYSYDTMRLRHSLPCGRDVWYTLYRRFFWNLSKLRN